MRNLEGKSELSLRRLDLGHNNGSPERVNAVFGFSLAYAGGRGRRFKLFGESETSDEVPQYGRERVHGRLLLA